jgi:sialate O-acetylesterase
MKRSARHTLPFFTFALAAALAPRASAGVKFPAIFGDHMVLQRGDHSSISGFADPGENIVLRGSWSTDDHTATADSSGRWRVEFIPPREGGPYAIRVRGSDEVILQDVLFGEVWVCSGQSNMEMPVAEQDGYSGMVNWRELLKHASRPTIRLFNVKNTVSATPREDCQGNWAQCDASSARGFSATGYFFACKLAQELDVPIGMIEADWGGTPVEAWTSADTLRQWPEFERSIEDMQILATHPPKPADYDAALAAWRRKIDELDAGSRNVAGSGTEWSSPTIDDSTWSEIDVPATWTGELATFDGLVWCRRAIDLAPEWAEREAVLELGPIDDMDVTFVNGAKIGETMKPGFHMASRAYPIAHGVLHAGRNVIAVRVLDTGGLGGINGHAEEVRLRAKDGKDVVPLAGKWRARNSVPMSALPAPPRWPAIEPHMPTSLFNGMIAPLVHCQIRGAIWYQGEQNVSHAHQYRTLFPAMIADWRARFGQGDFPFYFVQIAPFAYEDDKGEAAELREAQTMALSVPNTGMVVTMDIGNPSDIHPKSKPIVGTRLAECALAKTYRRSEFRSSSPLYRSMSIEGSSIRLSFDHAQGLTSKKPLEHFTIAGSDQKFVDARAVIDGETVVVSSDAVKEPVAVRYCWGAADEGTLLNGDHLPAPSFRTDTWRGVTDDAK